MKYTIDIPDEYKNDYVSVLENEFCYPIRTINKTYSIPTGLKIEPYIAPDRKVIEDEVWSFAKKVRLKEFFDDNYNLHPYLDYFNSYQDAKVKHEELNKIRVGDEVIYHGNKYVAGYVGADEVYHLVDQCWLRVVVQGDYQLTKTGRHFDEVEELLKKMRGETNEICN